MQYSIVYSTQTGNTGQLAEKLKASLPAEGLLYYGPPAGLAQRARLLFVGFWTNKGSCDTASSEFLQDLHNQLVFLFGTAGFGGSETYFAKILAHVKMRLDSSNTVEGSYMCQGKMPPSVRQRYTQMQSQQPEKMRQLIENYDQALTHPDQKDLEKLAQTAQAFLKKLQK